MRWLWPSAACLPDGRSPGKPAPELQTGCGRCWPFGAGVEAGRWERLAAALNVEDEFLPQQTIRFFTLFEPPPSDCKPLPPSY